MALGVAVVVFAVCLGVMLGATDRLVRALDQLGVHLHLTDGLLGALTALGADAPEISSAIVALQGGHHAIGLGVILGSNLFNLAALLGLGAVLGGRVSVKRASLVLDGGVGLLVTLLTAGLILQLAPPLLCAVLLAVVLIPYVAALALSPVQLSRLPLPARWGARLAMAVRTLDLEAAQDPRIGPEAASRPTWVAPLVIVPAVALIIGGSVGVVQTAVILAAAWSIPLPLVGTLLLAGLTSLPNAYAATRLARHGRGAALVSETFNSNTINLVVGVAVPAIAFGQSGALGNAAPDLMWLVTLTVVTLGLLARPGGLTRRDGLAIIGLYVLFMLVRVT
jgi:cation:H+ antiporter